MKSWQRALLVTGVAVGLDTSGMVGAAHAKSECVVICRDEVRACVRNTRPLVRTICRRAEPKPPFCRNRGKFIRRACRQIERTCAAAMPDDPICSSPSGAFLDP